METQVAINAETREAMVSKGLARFDIADATLAEWKAQALSVVVAGPNDKEGIKRARELRLKGRAWRIAIDKTHEALKADVNFYGRAMDARRRELVAPIVAGEEHLQLQEDTAERERARLAAEAAAKAEAARKAKLDERMAELAEQDGYWVPSSVEAMTDDEFAASLKIATAARADRLAAEAKELAERQAREAAEALQRSQIEAAEREARRIEGERIAAERAALAEQAAKNRKAQEEIDAKNRAAQKALDDQRAELAKEAARIQAVKDAEAKAAAEIEAAKRREEDARNEAARKAALASDAEKVLAYVEGVSAIQIPRVWCSQEIEAIVAGAMAEIKGLIP